MKTAFLLFSLACLAARAEDVAAVRMLDPKLNSAQRNNACFELRGSASLETIAALARALETPDVRSCAARNLREAGAVDELKIAFASADPDVRAAAARELGALGRPDLIEPLVQAARDPNLIVATNALEGLAQYQDPSVLPALLGLAEAGGPVAAMALSRAVQFNDPGVLAVARKLMATRDVTLRLSALRAIGDFGDATDLPALRELAAKAERAAPAGRGFGLVPAIDLSRAAQNAIRQIESAGRPRVRS
jgi:HEAT repeat protein